MLADFHPELKKKYDSKQYLLAQKIIGRKLALKINQSKMASLMALSYEKYLEMESGSVDISVEDYEMALEKITIDSELVKVTCNKCGDKNIEEEYDYERFSEISLSFGYGSMYDSEHWSFDLCDQCLTDLIKTFKLVPEGFGEDGYFAKYPQIMFEHWKETGEVNLEAGMTRQEIIEQGGSIYQSFCEDEEFSEE